MPLGTAVEDHSASQPNIVGVPVAITELLSVPPVSSNATWLAGSIIVDDCEQGGDWEVLIRP